MDESGTGLYKRDDVLKDLRTNVIEVHFEKVNGEPRIMRCTLLPRFLPESYRTNLDEQKMEKSYHAENSNLIAAWDVQNGGWRSFFIDKVTYCQVLDSYQ